MRFAIIDVANLFHRCQHVTHGDAFTKSGMALHIIFRSLKKLHREMKADHFVFCSEGRSWRFDVFPQYKAARRVARLDQTAREKEEAEIFFETLEKTINYLAEKTRCTVLQSQGVEADDFVARWIQLHPNDEHVILSGDSDFIQLIAPNVSIMDGVNDRLLTDKGVFDGKGQELVFSIDASKGKIKIKDTVAKEKKKHETEEKAKKKADPNYEPTPFVYDIEPEWWKRALFIKIVRGDTGDGIFSAYPGVRYEGSSKKTGIREAWEDRNEGGFNWNNFMLQRWEKIVGMSETGDPIKKEVLVLDEFKFNELLIDLTKQPEEIKELMDAVIVQAVQKEPVSGVGIHFLRFCNEHSLANLTKEANDHAVYLNRGYMDSK
jgi:hypothetical protein